MFSTFIGKPCYAVEDYHSALAAAAYALAVYGYKSAGYNAAIEMVAETRATMVKECNPLGIVPVEEPLAFYKVSPKSRLLQENS